MGKTLTPKACGKFRFDTEHEAKARGAFLEMTKPHKHPRPLRVYACSGCRGYHLTSVPLR